MSGDDWGIRTRRLFRGGPLHILRWSVFRSAGFKLPSSGSSHVRPADRFFKVVLCANIGLTAFCVLAYCTGIGTSIAGKFELTLGVLGKIIVGILFFNVLWGFLWYGVKDQLLKRVAKLSAAERHEVFTSRLSRPFDLAGLLQRRSERQIRIIDMIGRRGRTVMLAGGIFFYSYVLIDRTHPANFAAPFLHGALIEGILSNWLYIALYYGDGRLAAGLYGAQARIMDGALARANFLTVITLWAMFKFVMVPLGGAMADLYPPTQFASIFALIWGSYLVTDTLAEIGGALYGKQNIRVVGLGDVNRKSIAGTVTGFVGGLGFCLAIVLGNGLPPAFVGLAILISLSNTILELYSPRGTDDFTMATGNALICLGFGAWVLN